MKVFREVVKNLSCRIVTRYRHNTSREIARVTDTMNKLFTYFKDHTCPDPTIPGVHVLTLFIIVLKNRKIAPKLR